MQAFLSDFDRLTPAQRATVTHWIIDDPDRPGIDPWGKSSAEFAADVETERREGWAYDRS